MVTFYDIILQILVDKPVSGVDLDDLPQKGFIDVQSSGNEIAIDIELARVEQQEFQKFILSRIFLMQIKQACLLSGIFL